jgi:hypothetical protein
MMSANRSALSRTLRSNCSRSLRFMRTTDEKCRLAGSLSEMLSRFYRATRMGSTGVGGLDPHQGPSLFKSRWGNRPCRYYEHCSDEAPQSVQLESSMNRRFDYEIFGGNFHCPSYGQLDIVTVAE